MLLNPSIMAFNNDSEVQPVPSALPDTSAESEVQGAQTFTYFPKLPPELRHKIWKEACLIERVVDIWAVPLDVKGSTAFFENADIPLPYSFKSHSKIPIILHTSRESRSVGLENYHLSFGTETDGIINGMQLKSTSEPKIYINWESDIICPIMGPSVEWQPDPATGERRGFQGFGN